MVGPYAWSSDVRAAVFRAPPSIAVPLELKGNMYQIHVPLPNLRKPDSPTTFISSVEHPVEYLRERCSCIHKVMLQRSSVCPV